MADHFAGNCVVCGAAIDQQTLDEWCSSNPPFCWKCGTFYSGEGNLNGWTADQARTVAASFDSRINDLVRKALG